MNQAYSRLSTTHGHVTDCKLVCVYWTRLVLLRPAASLYSASPLKHHPTGKQWCPNLDHYSDSEPARRSLTLLCWALSRAAEPQILTSFVWRGRGSNHQAFPHAKRTLNHYTTRPRSLTKVSISDTFIVNEFLNFVFKYLLDYAVYACAQWKADCYITGCDSNDGRLMVLNNTFLDLFASYKARVSNVYVSHPISSN